MLALFYTILWFLLMGTAIFATQNTSLVQVQFLMLTSIRVPVGLLLVSSAGLGAVAVTVWQTGKTLRPRPPSKKNSPRPAPPPEEDDFEDYEDDFDDEPEDDWD
jgi:uncharacterized integral membrane protein